MFRLLLLAMAAPLAFAGKAAASMVEQDGYRYVQISLSGLWEGFFVFLFGIVFVLIGLFLFFLWRRSMQQRDNEPLHVDRGEDDGTVF